MQKRKIQTNTKIFDSSHESRVTSHFSRGFTLFYAVLVSSLLLAIGLAVLNITYKEFVLSSGARDSETAFYAADTALECALYWDGNAHAFGFYGDSLAEGLVGFWRFEDNPGETAIDSSGNGNHGILANPNVSDWTSAGAIDNGLTFNGTDDFVGVADAGSLDFGTSPYTITFWFQLNAPFDATTVTTLPFFSRYNSSSANTSAVLQGTDYTVADAGTAGRLRVKVESASGSPKYWYTNQVSWTAGHWYHVAIVVDDTPANSDIYIDGTRDSVAGQSAGGAYNANNITAPWQWGKGQYDPENKTAVSYFAGTLDEIRIYNRALTQTEVQAVHDGDVLAQFNNPIEQGSVPGSIMCGGDDINDPATGWYTSPDGDGWNVETGTYGNGSPYARTTFDMLFEDGTCSLTSVFKDSTSTTIIARGYNTCDITNPRRLERAIRAHY
jgi:hypothetical protein